MGWRIRIEQKKLGCNGIFCIATPIEDSKKKSKSPEAGDFALMKNKIASNRHHTFLTHRLTIKQHNHQKNYIENIFYNI